MICSHGWITFAVDWPRFMLLLCYTVFGNWCWYGSFWHFFGLGYPLHSVSLLSVYTQHSYLRPSKHHRIYSQFMYSFGRLPSAFAAFFLISESTVDFLAIAASFLSQPFTAFLVNVLAFLPFRRGFFRQSPFAAFCNWSPFASCNVQWISFQIYTGHDCVYSRIIFTIYLSTYLRIYQSIDSDP